MSEQEVEPAAILAALGLAGARVVAPVAGGWDTMIWRIEYEGRQYALRLFRASQTAVYRREVLAMRAASAAGLPVPTVRAEGVWQERPALLLSWIAGLPLARAIQARPARVAALGAAFGQTQARIHAVPAPDGLDEGRPDWIALAGPEEAALQERLRALAQPAAALLHLDYHPLNVMIDGGRVSGVLDWANAAPGDPRADLARTLAILRLSPPTPGLPRPVELLVRRLLEFGWRRGYRRQAGPVGDLALFQAWAGAMMLRDLAPKIGRPGIPLRAADLESIRRWTAAHKQRAGLA